MKRRQSGTQDTPTHEKYTLLLADLTRLLRMFKISKKVRSSQLVSGARTFSSLLEVAAALRDLKAPEAVHKLLSCAVSTYY